MKKKYNPFKMWGSYIGALMGFISALSGSSGATKMTLNGSEVWIKHIGWFTTRLNYVGDIGKTPFVVIFLIFLTIIFGFLLGWGIHSLVRYLRK